MSIQIPNFFTEEHIASSREHTMFYVREFNVHVRFYEEMCSIKWKLMSLNNEQRRKTELRKYNIYSEHNARCLRCLHIHWNLNIANNDERPLIFYNHNNFVSFGAPKLHTLHLVRSTQRSNFLFVQQKGKVESVRCSRYALGVICLSCSNLVKLPY